MLITHDLSVVQYFATRVAVLYLGMLCEEAATEELFSTPRHPYTQALLAAIPKLGKKGAKYIKMKGEVPTPINLPPGCVFHGRCAFANKRCQNEIPSLQKQESRTIACHAVEEGRI